MANSMKVRPTLKEGVTEVRILMPHDMETGRRKDDAGSLVPAWYITEVTAWHKERVVLEAQFGTAVSKNPYLIFRFKGGTAGDKVSVKWLDNQGESRLDEAEIVQ
jgi:sulfur-oxidizing protein SoxZ